MAERTPTVWSWPQPFEELEHTADVGVVVRGETPEMCLARLVLSFTSVVLGRVEPLAGGAPRVLEVPAGDRLTMAVDLLRELLYLFDTDEVVPRTCAVERFDEAAGARLVVEMVPFEEGEHEDLMDLKAVTWHEARFERTPDGWTARIIFDV